MTNQVIKDRVLRTEKLNWRNLKPFQPEDLKFMSQESFEILKNSIKKKDFVASITVWQEGNDYWILDGHHRIKALQELENEGHIIPVTLSCEIIDCKNEQEANDILLTYSSNHARLDEKGLKEFITNNDLNLEELKSTLDLNINFDALFGEIVAHNDANGLCDPDEIPEVIEPITKRGDIWLLGNHRVMCGDSTVLTDVEKLMDGAKADMV